MRAAQLGGCAARLAVDGDVMRRLLRDVAEGRALGDVTTLLDPSVTEQLREKMTEHDEA